MNNRRLKEHLEVSKCYSTLNVFIGKNVVIDVGVKRKRVCCVTVYLCLDLDQTLAEIKLCGR